MSATYQTGLRISEYLLQERLGAGSFAEVWRARHHIWESEHVAIKLPVEPEYVRYLQREGVVVHGIRHPNVVRVLGFDPYAEMPYLVMELVKGPALAQILKDHKNGLPIATIDTILRGVLAGILAAHTNHVLHRDIKPGNVLIHLDKKTLSEITPEDVKLVDFGLGLKNVDSLRSVVNSASIDRDSKLVGTLAYMAPELRDGQQQADARSDLYSIGVMLFEMLTGERPAGAEMPSAFRHDTPPGLDAVFQRLYARYDRRYESAQAVLDDLNERMRPLRMTPPLPVGNRMPVDLILNHPGDRFYEIVKLIRTARPDQTAAQVNAIAAGPHGVIFEGIEQQAGQKWRDVFAAHGATVSLVHSGSSAAALGQVSPTPPISGNRRFRYEGLDASGTKRNGELNAASRDEVIKQVRSAGLFPTKVDEIANEVGKNCPSCNHRVDADDQFCTNCGSQIASRIRRCPECGGFPGPRDQFCTFCGSGLLTNSGG